MKPTARNGKIDLLKFLFALFVIIYHFNNAVNYPNEIFTKGYIGVEFFFVVSGFLFAKSISKITYQKETILKDSFGFMKRKYLSLFPYHCFFFTATFLYCAIHYTWGIRKSFTQLLLSIPDFLMLRMGGISNLPLLGHEWYISAMLIVMFIFTPIAIRYRRFFLHYLCPVLFVGCIGYLYHQKHNLDFVSQWTGLCMAGVLRAAAEIAFGCICYVGYENKLLDKLPKPVLLILEIGLYAIIISYAARFLGSLNDYAVLFITAPAVLISFTPKASVGFLNNRFISFLGKLSYPIYLSQIFIRQILAPIDFGLGYAFHLCIYVVCVMAVSLICILIVDTFLKLVKKWKANAQKPDTAV